MARYTHIETIRVARERLLHEVTEVLKACDCEVIYLKPDYLLARETSGQVPFARLVTVEVLVDNTTVTSESASLQFVVKNEEIPLHRKNHCHQRYQDLIQAIKEHQGWYAIDSTNGVGVKPLDEKVSL